MFLSFHRAFIFLLDSFPEVREKLETTLKNFIENEDMRHKSINQDSRILFAYLSVSNNHSFQEFREAYVFETTDRKIKYIAEKVPQILDIEDKDFT